MATIQSEKTIVFPREFMAHFGDMMRSVFGMNVKDELAEIHVHVLSKHQDYRPRTKNEYLGLILQSLPGHQYNELTYLSRAFLSWYERLDLRIIKHAGQRVAEDVRAEWKEASKERRAALCFLYRSSFVKFAENMMFEQMRLPDESKIKWPRRIYVVQMLNVCMLRVALTLANGTNERIAEEFVRLAVTFKMPNYFAIEVFALLYGAELKTKRYYHNFREDMMACLSRVLTRMARDVAFVPFTDHAMLPGNPGLYDYVRRTLDAKMFVNPGAQLPIAEKLDAGYSSDLSAEGEPQNSTDDFEPGYDSDSDDDDTDFGEVYVEIPAVDMIYDDAKRDVHDIEDAVIGQNFRLEADEVAEANPANIKQKTMNMIVTARTQLAGLRDKMQKAIETQNKNQFWAAVRKVKRTLEFLRKQIEQLYVVDICPKKPYTIMTHLKDVCLQNFLGFVNDEFYALMTSECFDDWRNVSVNLYYAAKKVWRVMNGEQAEFQIEMDLAGIANGVMGDTGISSVLSQVVNTPPFGSIVSHAEHDQLVDAAEVTQQAGNIIFEDQRETVTEQAEPAGDPQVKEDQTGAITDSGWTMDKMANRVWPVANGNWNASDGLGKVLYSGIIPYSVIEAVNCNLPIKMLAKQYNFWRGTIKVRVVLNGTKFHCGRAMLVYVPYTTNANSKYRCLDNYAGLPHVELDASLSNSAELEIPFSHFMSAFRLRSPENYAHDLYRPQQYLGNVQLVVWNQLKATKTTKQSLKYSIFASMPESQFSIVLPLEYSKDVGFGNCAMNIKGAGTFRLESDSVKASNVTKAAVDRKAYRKPDASKTTASVAPTRVQKPKMDGKPADKIPLTINAPSVLRVVDNLASGAGLDTSQRLSLYPSSYTMHSVNRTESKGTDMSMGMLASQYGRIDVLSFTTSTTTNTQLASYQVSPTYVKTAVGNYNTSTVPNTFWGLSYQTTPLAFVARPFMFWTGTIKYKLQAITTQMHSGRLMITLNYYGTRDQLKNLGWECSSLRPTIIWDLQEKKELEFEVPFNANRPWLRCDHLVPYSLTNVKAGMLDIGALTDNKDQGQTYVAVMNIKVLNELVCPDNVSASIDINVSVAGGEDFMVTTPSNMPDFTGFDISNVLQPALANVPVLSEGKEMGEGWRLEADDAAQADVSSKWATGQCARAQPIKKTPGVQTMPEEIKSLKTVLQRHYAVLSLKVEHPKSTNDNFFCLIIPNTPCVSLGAVNKNGIQYSHNLISHFARAYTWWSGSLRYKVILPAQEGTYVSVIYKPNSFGPTKFKEVTPVTYLNELNFGTVLFSGTAASAIEFEVPFVTPYRQLTIEPTKWDGSETSGQIYIFIHRNGVKFDTRLFLFQAVGQDFEMNMPRCIPAMRFYGCEAGVPPVYDMFEWNRNTTDSGEERMDLEKGCTSSFMEPIDEMQNLRLEMFQTPAKVSAAATSAAEDFHEFTKEMKNSMADMRETAKALADAANASKVAFENSQPVFRSAIAATDGVAAISREAKHFLDFIKVDDISWTKRLALVKAIYNLMNADSWTGRVGDITVLCALLGLEGDAVLKSFCGVAKSFCGKNLAPEEVKQGFQLEAGTDTVMDTIMACKDWFKFIVTGIFTVVFSLVATRDPTMKESETFCEKMYKKLAKVHKLANGVKGMETLWTYLAKVVKKSVDWAVGAHTPGVLTWRLMAASSSGIADWLKKVPFFEGEDAKQRVAWRPDTLMDLYTLIDEGQEFVKQFEKDERPPKLAAFVKDGLHRLKTAQKEIRALLDVPPARIDPYCVCWAGVPGVGKSASIVRMQHEVLDALGYPKFNRFYSKSDTDEFWSRYNHETSVFIDDFYSVTDSPVVREFITLKSNVGYQLNMAGLEDKGKPMLSHFIWMTTNHMYPNPTEITKRTALLRRRDTLMWVRSVGERHEDGISHLRFDLKDKYQDVTLRGNMSWQEAKDFIVASAREYLAKQRILVGKILDMGEVVVSETTARSLGAGGLQGLDSVRVQTMDGTILPIAAFLKIPNIILEAGEEEAKEYMTRDQMMKILEGLNQPRHIECVIASHWFKYKITKEDLDKILQTYKKTGMDHVSNTSRMTIANLAMGGNYELDDELTPNIAKNVNLETMKYIGEDDFEAVTFDLLLDREGVEEVRKRVEALIRPKEKGFSQLRQKWLDKAMDAVKDVKNKIKMWFEKHPTVVLTLKILGGIAAFLTGAAMFRYMAPELFKSIEIKVAKWFGLDREEPNRFQNYGKKILSKDVQQAIDQGDIDLVRERKRENIFRKLKNWLGNKEVTAEEVEDLVLQAGTYSAFSRTPARPANAPSVMPGVLQSGEDPSRQLMQIVKKNIVMVTTFVAETKTFATVRGLCISGRYVLIPNHWWRRVEMGKKFWVFEPRKSRIGVFRLEGMSFELGEGVDAVVIKLPISIPAKRNIIRHFADRKELTIQSTMASLVYMDSFVERGSIEIDHDKELNYEVVPVRADAVDIKSYDLGSGNMTRRQFGWVYRANTNLGWCGSPLIAENNRLTGKILGFHIASDPKVGTAYSIAICREVLERFNDDMVGTSFVVEGLVEPGALPKVEVDGNFSFLGALPNDKAVAMPVKTDIKPSLIFELVAAHETEPSVLSSWDKRNKSGVSPAQRAVNKYGKQCEDFQPVLVEMVREDLLQEIKEWKQTMPKRLLSQREIVLGNDMFEFCDRMNMHTSPGYPYVLGHKGRGKAWMFDLDQGDVLDEELRERFIAREQKALMGQRSDSIWMDCLKDERRPLEKIVEGKTRLFTIPPVDFTMLMRRYTMAFACMFYENNCASFSAVGCDPYSLDWTRIYFRLARKSEMVMAGDFSTFDGNMHPSLIKAFFQIVSDWMKDAEEWNENWENVYDVLADEIIHTYQLCINTLYQTHQGNPSGNPLTVVLNTFVHAFYIRLAWLILAQEKCPGLCSMKAFHKHVVEIYYGDDDVVAISGEVIKWFNQESVSDVLLRYGIEYSDETKSGTIQDLRKIDEVTFLKNGFKRHPDCFMLWARMTKITITELTNWIRKSDDDLIATRENCEEALKFAYFWGKEYFESIMLKINLAFLKVGLPLICDRWEWHDYQFRKVCGMV